MLGFFPKAIATSVLVGRPLKESLEGQETFAREFSVWSQYNNSYFFFNLPL